jgi:glycine/D-amino acid oxidase-like deaminating enzyme
MDIAIDMDAVVFGGGAAGLWTLDELSRAGLRCLLLESNELGAGQTVASQGIIHGGMKYTLSGLFSASARAIADMPDVWRACLAGERQPDLTGTRLRSHFCYLWQTESLASKLGMLGARAALRIRPRRLETFERPPILRDARGTVARLDEQVIEPWSFVSVLSERHRGRILKVDARSGLEFGPEFGHAPGRSAGQDRPPTATGLARGLLIRMINPDTGDPLDLRAGKVILAAGAGNAALRQQLGLSGEAMQRRPLHMVMVRSPELPVFNGHCIDGAVTRVTITSTRDFGDRPVWQVGGEIAERGVSMNEGDLAAFARKELEMVLPGLNLTHARWATYRVDRAESAAAGARPNDATVNCDGPIITAWPTKLALAPRLAATVRDMVVASTSSPLIRGDPAREPGAELPFPLRDWPRPVVALPPWETPHSWITLD